MADLISIILILVCFLFGLNSPKKAGWTALFIGPLFGPTSLTVAGSAFFPLTIYRIVFAISIGVLISRYGRDYPISRIFKSNFVKILLLFVLMVLMVSFQDRAKNMIFSFIPNIICAITLCFVLINDRYDLMRFIKIFVIHASIISFFILVEFYSDFNLTFFLQQSIPGLEADELRVTSKLLNPQDRTGIYRPGGIDGNAAQTGFRLSVLFPLTLWFISRKKILSILPAILTLVAFFHLQTRATWFAVAISILFLFSVIIQNYSFKIKKNILLGFFVVSIGISIFFIIVPAYYDFMKYFVNVTLVDSFDFTKTNSIEHKILRIPFAFQIISKSPIWGYLVSRHYAEQYMFWGLDLPSPLIYLMSGGIILTSVYLLHLFIMPISTFMMSKSKKYNSNQKEYLLFVTSGLLAGIFSIFTNYQEGHLLIMYMLYITIYKVFIFEKMSDRRILNIN